MGGAILAVGLLALLFIPTKEAEGFFDGIVSAFTFMWHVMEVFGCILLAFFIYGKVRFAMYLVSVVKRYDNKHTKIKIILCWLTLIPVIGYFAGVLCLSFIIPRILNKLGCSKIRVAFLVLLGLVTLVDMLLFPLQYLHIIVLSFTDGFMWYLSIISFFIFYFISVVAGFQSVKKTSLPSSSVAELERLL